MSGDFAWATPGPPGDAWTNGGIAFWITLFGICVSVGSAILASLADIDPTQIEAGLIGAFLGSSPVILMPVAARTVLDAGSAFAYRGRLAFRGLTLEDVRIVVELRTAIPA